MRFGTWGMFLLVAGVLFGFIAAMIGADVDQALADAMQRNAFGVILGLDPTVDQARQANQLYKVLSYASLFCFVFGVAGCCIGFLGASIRGIFGTGSSEAASKPKAPQSAQWTPEQHEPQLSSSAAFREFAWGDAPASTLVAAELTDRDKLAIKRFGMAKEETPWRKFRKINEDLSVCGIHVKELAYWFEEDSFRLAIAYLDPSQYAPLLRAINSAYGQGSGWRDLKSTLWRSQNLGSNLLVMPEVGEAPPTLVVFDGHRYPVTNSDSLSKGDKAAMVVAAGFLALFFLLVVLAGC